MWAGPCTGSFRSTAAAADTANCLCSVLRMAWDCFVSLSAALKRTWCPWCLVASSWACSRGHIGRLTWDAGRDSSLACRPPTRDLLSQGRTTRLCRQRLHSSHPLVARSFSLPLLGRGVAYLYRQIRTCVHEGGFVRPARNNACDQPTDPMTVDRHWSLFDVWAQLRCCQLARLSSVSSWSRRWSTLTDRACTVASRGLTQ